MNGINKLCLIGWTILLSANAINAGVGKLTLITCEPAPVS